MNYIQQHTHNLARQMSGVQLFIFELAIWYIFLRDRIRRRIHTKTTVYHWVGRSANRWLAKYPERVKFIFLVGRWRFYLWLSVSLEEPQKYRV